MFVLKFLITGLHRLLTALKYKSVMIKSNHVTTDIPQNFVENLKFKFKYLNCTNIKGLHGDDSLER